jgi:hypothetical protein
MDRYGQSAFGLNLPDNILIEMLDNFPGGGDFGEEFLGRASSPLFLVENGLAQLDAFAADVNISGTFDQRTDIPITFAAERAESIFLRSAAGAATAASHHILA